MELIIVLAIATALTALLMPVFAIVRESAQRVICASNERQIGMAMIMYADAHRGHLPYSAYGDDPNFSQQDMMAAHRGGGNPMAWEGIGLLFQQHYCNSAECLYCPSHHGSHSYDRYQNWYDFPVANSNSMVFTNYHYSGDFDRTDMEAALSSSSPLSVVPIRKKRLLEADLVLLTDGLRTAGDFSHQTGMNVLRGDGSVRWRDDDNTIYPMLPTEELSELESTEALYVNIWQIIVAD